MARNKYWIYSWKGGYLQALGLADNLPGLIIKRENSNYRYQKGDTVINWGSSVRPPMMQGLPMLNPPELVGIGKLKTYHLLKETGVKTLEYTQQNDTAKGWQRAGYKVVGRDSNHGMGGVGITVYQPDAQLKNHKFFTKYSKKEREFRIHCFLGKVIFVQEKLKKNGEVNADKYIRSHGRGWCFAFKHLPLRPVPDGVTELGLAAVNALGLDFGGVDIGWSAKGGATIFEVNTAPGIEETSLAAYVKTIQRL